MPLKKGKKNIGKNIEELESTGRKHKVAEAIALDYARRTGSDVGPKPRSKSKKRKHR